MLLGIEFHAEHHIKSSEGSNQVLSNMSFSEVSLHDSVRHFSQKPSELIASKNWPITPAKNILYVEFYAE